MSRSSVGSSTIAGSARSGSSGRSSKKSRAGKRLAQEVERLPRTSPSSTNDPLPDFEKLKYLKDLVANHVDSYNFALGDGLKYGVQSLIPQELSLVGHPKIRIWFEDVSLGRPTRPSSKMDKDSRLFPSEARERHMHYSAPLNSTVCFSVGDSITRVTKSLGDIPVMIGSTHCHLSNASPQEMVRRHEDATEIGGYFICNGIERCVRMLQIPRRNHIMAMERPSFQKRGPLYSNKAVTLRSVGPDQTGVTVTVHYLTDGTASVRFGIRKSEYFIPVMLLLKALKPPMATDKEIYTNILRGAHLDGDTFISDRVELSLRQVADLRLFTAQQCRAYLGRQFRTVMRDVPDDATDEEAGTHLLHSYIFIHLNNYSLGNKSSHASDLHSDTVLTDDEIGHEKFNLLIEMLRKLYLFVSEKVGADNPDALNNHELLLGGHLFGMMLKERLQQFLMGCKAVMRRELTTVADPSKLWLSLNQNDGLFIRKVLTKQTDIGRKMFYFLSTGNLVSESGLDLMQTAGFTVVAEKLNRYRYLSHFRSVHRGQFFTEMKTTAVRKLLPEAFGYLCPVHTPDGTPCGLLNHLSSQASVVTHHPRGGGILQGFDGLKKLEGNGQNGFETPRRKKKSSSGATTVSVTPTMVSSLGTNTTYSPLAELVKNLTNWGVQPAGPRSTGIVPSYKLLPVLVDGRVVGHAPEALVGNQIVPRLRRAKAIALGCSATELKQLHPHQQQFETARLLRDCIADPHRHFSATVEVVFVPESKAGGAAPGLFLFTDAARLLRPVVHLETGFVELIGAMAQTFMEIAIRPEEVRVGVDTHVELWPTSMLSLIASLTPFSDFNQSPRNMYQCQMGKQTMGTPAHNLRHRPDNKMYRIQTPQSPLVQNMPQATYSMDEYPNGTNAVVAVISYTGYDMEDAMILNKSSFERGFAHASVYKTKVIDLTELRGDESNMVFSNLYPASSHKSGQVINANLGPDGLPFIGQHIKEGDAIACYIDEQTGQSKVEKHKDSEPAIIDQVRLLGTSGEKASQSGGVRKISITFRYNRNPVVGDKFSSRHGQKGVLSIKWPQEDMPFTESGMTPDVIINPHAFPSRMTIGMLIESMAGKAGALHGVYQDSTPFTMQGDTEGETAVDYFGEQLRAAGYNYYGSEPLYSGLQGTLLQADIYIGVVYYQRLRHMVSDKSQVRSLGPIDPVTRQPVKGRKRHGGVRFGEMERDSLLAHGTSFLMRDRLLNSSDKHIAYICCGSLLSVHNEVSNKSSSNDSEDVSVVSNMKKDSIKLKCRVCGKHDKWRAITIPYVFRYLVNELAAMGMKIELK